MMQQPPNPADLLGPALVLETQAAGRTAALAGLPRRSCPWPSPTNDRDAALQSMWVKGYSTGLTELRQRQSPEEPSAPRSASDAGPPAEQPVTS